MLIGFVMFRTVEAQGDAVVVLVRADRRRLFSQRVDVALRARHLSSAKQK